MADIFSKEFRSSIMGRIKSKNTNPEVLVRKYLHRHGFRFRLHKKELPGTPDIVLKGCRTVIFVHGCFWHGHESCKKSTLPKTRTEEWEKKIKRNRELDLIQKQKLINLGWNVIIVWECELKQIDATMNNVINNLLKAKRKFISK